MIEYNLNHVVSICRYYKCKVPGVSYYTEKTGWFGRVLYPAGYYQYEYDTLYPYTIKPNQYTEDGYVYYKPYVELNISDGETINEYFETPETMDTFIEKHFNHFVKKD